MGSRSRFECQSCHYQAVVSGGDSVGMMVETTTVSCNSCKKLMDVVVSRPTRESRPESDRGMGRPGRERLPIACRNSPSHKVHKWSHPGPCPVCGQTMQLVPGMPICWD